MKNIPVLLQEFFRQFDWQNPANILTVIVGVITVMQILWGLGLRLWKCLHQSKLQRDLHPFYTPEEIQRATQYYVETKCQNVAPSKAEEPRRGHAFATKQKSIPFF